MIPGKGATPTQQEASPEATGTFPEMVFRDYDIRGIARNQLTSQFAQQLGKALAQRAIALGEHTLILGRDGRQTSKQLSEALEQGILSIGCNVIHLGLVPTPLLNFATHHLHFQTACTLCAIFPEAIKVLVNACLTQQPVEQALGTTSPINALLTFLAKPPSDPALKVGVPRATSTRSQLHAMFPAHSTLL